jgi:hypothetical protein
MHYKQIKPSFPTLFLLSATCWLLAAIPMVHGWGSGHNPQTKCILDLLPQEIHARFSAKTISKTIHHDSHYPDSFNPFETEVPEDIREILASSGLKKRYDLHKVKGQTVAFRILVKLFREDRNEDAGLWCAVLSHGLGDAGAPNHHPLMHWVQYAFHGNEIQLGNGSSLQKNGPGNLMDCLKTDAGKKAVADMLQDYRPTLLVKPGPDMAQRALIRFAALDYEAADNMASQTGLIFKGWQARLDAKTAEERAQADATAARGWASLMTMPARLAADAIYTADYLAKQGVDISGEEVTQALEIHRQRYGEAIAKRPLALDSIYEGLLTEGIPAGSRVGVLIEPTYIMNHGQFGFEAKFHAAAAMLALKEAGISYASLDVRQVYQDGLPTPQQLPVLILASRGNPGSHAEFRDRELIKRLADFAKQGGRILHIGQRPLSAQRDFSGQIVKVAKPGNLPIPEENLLAAKLVTSALLSPQARPLEHAFRATPMTPAGWQRPYLRFTFKASSDRIIPLVGLVDADSSWVIAALSQTADGKLTGAFLPELALYPWLHEDRTLKRVDQARYDRLGSEILQRTVRLLLAGRLDPVQTKAIQDDRTFLAAPPKKIAVSATSQASAKRASQDVSSDVSALPFQADLAWDFKASQAQVLACPGTPAAKGILRGAKWLEDPQRGHVLSFAGHSDRVQFANPDLLKIGNGDFALSCWIRPETEPIRQKGGMIYTRGGYANPCFTLYFSVKDCKVRLQLRNQTKTFYAYGKTALEDGAWHHVLVCLDRTANQIRLYLDGRLDGQGALPAGDSTFDSSKPALLGAGGRDYVGLLDAFQLFHRSFSEAEAAALYQASKL